MKIINPRRRRALVAAVAALSLVVVGCGSAASGDPDLTGAAPTTDAAAGDETSPDADADAGVDAEPADPADPADGGGHVIDDDETAAAFPVTVTFANGDITIAQRPEAVISLSPTATEMLFAIGAGDQVIAVDDQSDYPAEAPRTDLSGYQPNVEAIVGYAPDLVVVAGDTVPDSGDSLVGALTLLGVPVLVAAAAADVDGSYDQIEQLGLATGHVDEAAAVVAEMEAAIATAIASAPPVDRELTIYHEIDPTPYSATSATYIGKVYEAFGLTNIADASDADGFGYPQLSVEAIVAANPDVIFLADAICCNENAETVSARDGWGEITAVKNGWIYELDDSAASRWGPRVVQTYETVAKALADVG